MGRTSRARAFKEAWWPREGERLVPVVSALLLALAFPPMHSLVLPFVGLAPLALWLYGLPDGPLGRASAMRGSLLFGALYFGILYYWIVIALIWFSKLAILAYIGTIGILIVMSALFGWWMHHALNSYRFPLWLALPIAWTAMEWSRAHLPSTIAFPWLGLGSSLTGFPELVGIAEIVGSRGATFWLALVNALVAGLVLSIRSGRGRARALAILVAVIALPAGWGVWRANNLEMREVGTVAVVQPNIPQHLKLDAQAARDSTWASLARLMPQIAPGSVDLVAMPEVVMQFFPEAPFQASMVDPLQSYSREAGAPIVFGSLGVDFDEVDPTVFTRYNSAFVMEPQGLADYRYDKRYLVPFVERLPLLPDRWIPQWLGMGSYGIGDDWPLVEVDEALYGVLICYESSYPMAARTVRLDGADVLLNLTNDAWYGREPLYARTTALWQHPAHMVMRAIENRVGVARAANTGISLFVDPVGRVTDPTRLFEADVHAGAVYTTDVVTFYTRYGDLVGNAAAIAALFLALTAIAQARRARRLDHSPA